MSINIHETLIDKVVVNHNRYADAVSSPDVKLTPSSVRRAFFSTNPSRSPYQVVNMSKMER